VLRGQGTERGINLVDRSQSVRRKARRSQPRTPDECGTM
jgi:hypothetical protein